MDIPVLIDLPDKLESDRTIIRPYRAGDGQAVFDAVDESRQHILPWMPWGPHHVTSADSEKFVRTWRGHWELRQDLPVGIFDKSTGAFVGGAGLHRIDWELRSFEIGYWIRASAHGKGYVTDAVKLLTALAFVPLGANRVFIRCASGNIRSAAVAKRAGYLYEGTFRNSIKDAFDNLHDVLVFSLIPEDWQAMRDQNG